jgi:hypothetical protein
MWLHQKVTQVNEREKGRGERNKGRREREK